MTAALCKMLATIDVYQEEVDDGDYDIKKIREDAADYLATYMDDWEIAFFCDIVNSLQELIGTGEFPPLDFDFNESDTWIQPYHEMAWHFVCGECLGFQPFAAKTI